MWTDDLDVDALYAALVAACGRATVSRGGSDGDREADLTVTTADGDRAADIFTDHEGDWVLSQCDRHGDSPMAEAWSESLWTFATPEDLVARVVEWLSERYDDSTSTGVRVVAL